MPDKGPGSRGGNKGSGSAKAKNKEKRRAAEERQKQRKEKTQGGPAQPGQPRGKK